jgi:glycosyltransferase involved in cell wall biosynthesis
VRLLAQAGLEDRAVPARPTVSVVLPVLNGAAHLTEAIGSILAQSFDDLELIVADDGSDDASREIAAGFTARDGRVRLIALARDPATLSGARADNAAQSLARGEFIARMDQDDVAEPQRLAVQLPLMEAERLDVCGSQAICCGDRDDPLWFPEHHDAVLAELIFRPAMVHASQTMRAAVRRAAPLDETVVAEDYEWQTRMAGRLRFGNAAQTLVRYRIHAAQGSQVRRAAMLADWSRFRFRYFFERFPEARLEDFRAVNLVATRSPIGSAETLERAGAWLARLAALPDKRLKARMGRRWADACERSRVAEAAAIHARGAVAIGG